jgi:2-desacetyl-2-hydroxyethyl bacteriochlorophyllide A dehydrogenase
LNLATPGYDGAVEGRALTFVAPRRVEIQRIDVQPPRDGEVLVRARWSGISGGTELLAYRGELDPDLERDEALGSLGGTFRYPFAYGYGCAGTVEASRTDDVREGDAVFAFHPHQEVFALHGADVVALEGVDGRLATLFPLVETAFQVTLDAGPRLEERVVVLGLGPVGVLVAALLQRSGADVLGADPREDRRESASGLGVRAVDLAGLRETLGGGVPLVVEASGHPSALPLALELLAHEGEALVCSWYGTKEVPLPLGGAFHRRRLRIRSTQVSTIPAALAGRWDVPRRRRAVARLMTELPLKLLATHEVPFERAAQAYEALDRRAPGLMHVALRY